MPGVGSRDSSIPPAQLQVFLVQPRVQCDGQDQGRPASGRSDDIPWQRCVVVPDRSVNPQLSAAWSFKYDAPTLVFLTPTLPTSGGVMTLRGFNFGSAAPDIALLRDGVTLPCVARGVVYNSDSPGVSEVQCAIGEGVGRNWDVRFVVGGQQLSRPAPIKFSFMRPAVTSLSISGGPTDGGYNLTIVGSNVSQRYPSVRCVSSCSWCSWRACPSVGVSLFAHSVRRMSTSL
jgi:hypothetical protein